MYPGFLHLLEVPSLTGESMWEVLTVGPCLVFLPPANKLCKFVVQHPNSLSSVGHPGSSDGSGRSRGSVWSHSTGEAVPRQGGCCTVGSLKCPTGGFPSGTLPPDGRRRLAGWPCHSCLVVPSRNPPLG